MKRILNFFPLALMALALTFTACEDDDPCKDVDCGPNGNCFDGICICNEGYEGFDCNTEWVNKFVGTYNVEDVCTGENPGTYTYVATITRLDSTRVQIDNFAGFNEFVRATVSRVNASANTAEEITISNFTDASGRVFDGGGTIGGSSISIDYTVTYDDNTEDNCSATYVKQ